MPDSSLGLTSEAARRLLAQAGPNAIVDMEAKPLRRAFNKLWAPVPWMLEAAILLQIVLADYVEAGVVALLLISNAALGFFQEGRAQATLDALKLRLALIASVRRDAKWTNIPATELVVGDVLKLSLGTVVAADVHLIAGSILVDQSMLTGESLPIESGAGQDVYAGALVRRGESVAQVTATGERTKFGRTAELVRTAKVESSQQKTIMAVVRNLAIFNGSVTVLLTVYALLLHMPHKDILPLVLVALLSSIPVALPSMFTLSAAVGARALARQGVLPTSLLAVDEAAGIDVLCADKTGTLTRNELTVMSVCAIPGSKDAPALDESTLLALAALASSDGGQDPVDAAIRTAALLKPLAATPTLLTFTPFDPAVKRSEATVKLVEGTLVRVVKGAFDVVQKLSGPSPAASAIVADLQAKGFRVLAVASGIIDQLKLVGFIALSDPPRADSAALIAELSGLGVRTIMLTGDAKETAIVVASAIGISGPVWSTTPLPDNIKVEDFAIFAGVLPEDKYRLVKALQATGHIVGMCGDGANDAPALRQAQMGIAVSTATDVAKSAAGIVLTNPGLVGIVVSVKEGRTTFQRVLTYTLRSIVHKIVQVVFLAAGLIMTGQAILTPMLMVLMMVTGDFLAMSSSTDNVRPSPRPSIWKIGHLTIAGIVLGAFDLVFCIGCLATGKFMLNLDIATLRTLTVVTLVFSGQAVFYVARERRRLWSSRPGTWLLASSVVDLSIVGVLALNGILMAPLPFAIVAALFGAASMLAIILDEVKIIVFKRLQIA